MIRQKNSSKVLDMVEEELLATNKTKDNSKLLKEFYKLKYPQPNHYQAKDVVRVRRKLKISQAVFAHLLNANVSTVQKWERGAREPNGTVDRLLQILEKKGLKVLQVN